MDKKEKLVEVSELKKYFVVGHKGLFNHIPVYLKAVDDISFDIYKGETLGLVGESGCGKSTVARTMIRLHEPTSGSVIFEGKDLVKMKHRTLNSYRRNFQMIFQDPYASLNPRMTIGDIIAEPMIVFKSRGQLELSKKEIKDRVKELLTIVGLRASFINRYPHEFSGGQRQRIGIARALALNPKLILCDEPVSALDVSIQSQIVNLLQELQDKFNLTYLFIAHDLSVVKHISDRVAVMYLGKIVEIAGFKEIYDNPLHPYTKALLSAIPIPDPIKEKTRKRIILIGDVKYPVDTFKGCKFYDRCFEHMDICKEKSPELINMGDDHQVSCFLYDKR
ncbi:MAG: ABC transporter ATP-binding protein [Exilispira sp.]